MKVQDININDPVVKNKVVDTEKLPVKMEGLFISPKTRPINIMCERCHKRLMELKQQATKLFVVHFLQGRNGEKHDTTSFYKGRVLDKLSLPPQASQEWVHSNHGNGHCNNCETTEEQLKMGAVSIVKDHENRLTTALKSVKSQRIASGYRSDSVLGPSLGYKKSNHRSVDKISNLHKSTENLKSNYVELASFGPPPPKPTFKSYNGHAQHAPPQQPPQTISSHSNQHSNEHAYANLPAVNQQSSHSINTASSNSINSGGASQITANLNTNYTKNHDQAPKLDVKLASNVDTPWHGPEPSVSTDVPNRTITDLAAVPPKRTDSTRFSSRLKRKKDSKSSTPSSTPEPKINGQTNSSFFAKASQMFRKRKKERPMTYAELMRLFAPPPPQSFLRAHHTEGNSTHNYSYNVKVGMRITPNPQNKESILSVDEAKSTVLIANETLFFDYVHGPHSKQIDICASMLSDVLPAILHGRSVVVVTFGKNSPGRQYSLIGSRDSTQSLGLVPTAVTWLNKLGEDDRSKCGPNTINVTSLRLDEQKCLSEFVGPANISKSEDLGKYLDKLTLTLPAREHPNDEALIINMTFNKSKSKKKSKDSFGMLTFIDVGTPIRKNDNASLLCWNWLQDVTQTTGSKYFESFVQLRHNLMQGKTHVVSIGHITHSPKDYQAIGITLNLATRLYMRHLPPHKRSELQRLKKEKEYSSATSTGEESADTVIYRPGLVSDGEGPPKSYLPVRTKGDGQEKSPQFSCSKRGVSRGFSDTERGGSRGFSDAEERLRKQRLRTGYHSDTGQQQVRRGTGYASDTGNYNSAMSNYIRQQAVPQPAQPHQQPHQQSHQPTRPRQYALTDTEDLMRPRYTATPSARQKPYSDTENRTGVHVEPAKRRQTTKSAEKAEDIRQKRVQKNQQQLKRYFELLRLKNQREAILQQSREMRGVSTPEPGPEDKPMWSVENPTKPVAPVPSGQQAGTPAPGGQQGAPTDPAPQQPPSAEENSRRTAEENSRRTAEENNTEDKENEDVKFRARTKSESRNKGDNRRLYTIYDTEDDGAVLEQFAQTRRNRSGYKSDSGLKTNREKNEISREWLQKIKKKRHPPPGGKFIDYGVIDFNEKPQIREVKPKRVKSSLSEDELITRGHHQNCNLFNRDLRYSERRFDKQHRSGYSTDADPPAPRPKHRGSGYQSDGAPARHRNHRNHRPAERVATTQEDQRAVVVVEEIDLALLLEQVHEIEVLVTHKMQWRGAVADLDYFDQQIRILERRNALIEKLRRKQLELLSDLKATKNNLMSTDWKPDLTVDSTMNENAPGYLSALWKETSNLEIRLNTCKSKILVETSFM